MKLRSRDVLDEARERIRIAPVELRMHRGSDGEVRVRKESGGERGDEANELPERPRAQSRGSKKQVEERRSCVELALFAVAQEWC
jgi:hypothetical protein